MDTILTIISFLVVIALLTVPGLWGGFITFSLLGHLSQFLPGQKVDKQKE